MKTNVFEELIELAEDWRDFSLEANGWNCWTYYNKDGEECAWCYFSDNGSHSDVTIKSEGDGYFASREVASVGFFSNPVISSLTIASIKALESEIKKSRAALEWNKQNHAEQSAEEKERKRLAEIKKHREALEDLEIEK